MTGLSQHTPTTRATSRKAVRSPLRMTHFQTINARMRKVRRGTRFAQSSALADPTIPLLWLSFRARELLIVICNVATKTMHPAIYFDMN
jgi:hypothetical protein